MNFPSKKFCFVFSIFLICLVTVESLKCYRCSSTDAIKDPYQCNEFFDDSALEPQPCDDVYNAQYCIKQIGRFEGDGIKCFQCDSARDISCTDMLVSDGTLKPESCDWIYDAQYCVKNTDGVGTKRFCSSADFGNYCNYVRQPGDMMEYRSCYFTCSGDGCNAAIPVKPLQNFSLLLLPFLTYHLS